MVINSGYTALRLNAITPHRFDDYDVVVGYDMDVYAISDRFKVPFIVNLRQKGCYG